jgi:hypothetical protein
MNAHNVFYMTSRNVRYFSVAKGDAGDVYRAVGADDPTGELRKRVFKYPVSEEEVKMAMEWAARNHDKEEEYSAGPVKKVYFNITYITLDKRRYKDFEFVNENGKPINDCETVHNTEKPLTYTKPQHFGLEMTNLGDTTYEDCRHKLSLGEIVLLYLMLVLCTLRLAGIKLFDTAWHNCMCQGKEEDFKIFLVDTEQWEMSPDESFIMQNFQKIISEFRRDDEELLDEALHPIKDFLETSFDFEGAFLDAMQASCVELTDHFLCDPKANEKSVHYHDRIDSLLTAIGKETAQAHVRLQAFQAYRRGCETTQARMRLRSFQAGELAGKKGHPPSSGTYKTWQSQLGIFDVF